MAIRNGFKNYLLELLANQRGKRDMLQASIQKELDDVNGKIAALEATLAIYEESVRNSHVDYKMPVSPHQLSANAKTQEEGLAYLANHMDGVVHYGKARDLMIASGLSKGKPRNVGSHLYRMMHESNDWEWIAPGTFRYLKYKPSLFPKDSVAK